MCNAGRGIHGAVFPGCAETFESQESFEGQEQGQGQGKQKFIDRHQKLRRIQQGEIMVVPAGITHWTYNDGDVPLVLVSLTDLANEVNQLDLRYRVRRQTLTFIVIYFLLLSISK